MSGASFLTTFTPLVRTAAGRRAWQSGSKPFIDGSCRREPDFESPFPSITALCRLPKFVPRLEIGSRVAYLTAKGKYTVDRERGWRLVAVLRVIHRFPNHREAADWYLQNGYPLPSNCMVTENAPKELKLTHHIIPAVVRKKVDPKSDPDLAIHCWDVLYKRRSRECSLFFVTKAELRDLENPPQVLERDFLEVFGKVPGMQNPPRKTSEELDRLVRLALERSRSAASI
jgi:hypothetical protein